MANTYTQLYIQLVFAVKGRESLIPPLHREEIHQYIAGIIRNKGQKLYAIFAMPDHIHIFLSMTPTIAISDLVRDIKADSSRFITEKGLVPGKFAWQNGFGAFSYAQSQTDAVVKYIMQQESHHKKRTFQVEYLDLLSKFKVNFDDKYLFDWIE